MLNRTLREIAIYILLNIEGYENKEYQVNRLQYDWGHRN